MSGLFGLILAVLRLLVLGGRILLVGASLVRSFLDAPELMAAPAAGLGLGLRLSGVLVLGTAGLFGLVLAVLRFLVPGGRILLVGASLVRSFLDAPELMAAPAAGLDLGLRLSGVLVLGAAVLGFGLF